MEVKLNRIDNENVALEITVPKDRVNRAYNSVYRQVANEQKFPGFRKGKVPKEMIRQMLGKFTVANQVLEEILPEVYRAACEKVEIVPISQPEFDPWPEVEEKQDLEIKIRVSVLPDFEVCDYSKIPVDLSREIKVDDSEVDQTMENIKNSLAEFVPLVEDRGCIETDEVTVDYEVYEIGPDGAEKLADSQNDTAIRIGQGDAIPEIENNIIGMKAGDSKSFDLEFEEDHPRQELAGKKARYNVTVKSVRRRKLPDNDEELLAKMDGEFKSVDELRENVKDSLEQQKKQMKDSDVTQAMVDFVLGKTGLQVPQFLVDQEIDDRFNELERMLGSSGMTLEDYARRQDRTVEEMREGERQNAESTVKRQIVFNRIFKDEELEITDKEIERAASQFAMENKLRPSVMRKLAKHPSFLSNMRQRIREAKVSSFLKEKIVYNDDAEWEEVKARLEEPPTETPEIKEPEEDQDAGKEQAGDDTGQAAGEETDGEKEDSSSETEKQEE